MNAPAGWFAHPFVEQPGCLMKGDYATYQLVVRGELDERYGYLFEGMEMQRTEGKTVLIGSVRDQAKLHGLIERIEELGVELLSVQQVPTSPPGSGQERREA